MTEHSRAESRNERREVLVEDIMSRNVVTVPYSSTIGEAARVMKKNGIGCVVVKKDSELLGIVTERDIVRVLAEGRPETSTVIDTLSKPLITIGPNDPVSGAARILSEKGIRRLPVVEGQSLVGILTSTDVVNFYAKMSRQMMKNVGP